MWVGTSLTKFFKRRASVTSDLGYGVVLEQLNTLFSSMEDPGVSS